MSIKKYLPKRQYTFSVSATLEYNIEATSEEEARKILVNKGGLDISYDEIYLDENDYKMAECIEEIDLDDN
tara:strand:- start:343 stop:555 length:213 start_codon:yes stop_codon:yes gene_type:complete